MDSTTKEIVESRYWVPMVGHAFRALETFFDNRELGLQDVTAETGISKSSAFRILFTLENLGYVSRNPATGKYRLGVKVHEAAHRARSSQGLLHIARPHMKQLIDRFGETVNLAVRQNDNIVYLEILDGRQAFRMTGEVGTRAPLHASAIGKAIAAFLPHATLHAILENYRFTRLTRKTITTRDALLRELEEIRSRRYSLDEEEVEIGVVCVAVPILNGSGESDQALSLSGPAHRMRKSLKAIVRELRAAAAAIAQRLAP